MHGSRTKYRWLALAAGAALAVAACGDDSESASIDAGATTETTAHDDGHGSMDMGGEACPADAMVDDSYAVEVSGAKASSTEMMLTVTRDGEPVSGADVCIAADMTGMSHAGIGGMAMEMSAGMYSVPTKFAMRGSWDGEVVVVDGDHAVRVPIRFEVN